MLYGKVMKQIRLALTALFLASSAGALADTLVTNENGKLERFTDIIIGDDGRVRVLFRGNEASDYKVAKIVDAAGRAVVPGRA